MKRWGFTFQKPAFSAYEQDPGEVQKWLQQQYPYIRVKAKRQQGLILWMDELGLRSQHTSGKSYAPKGKTPVLGKSGNRFYLTMLTAISSLGHLIFTVEECNFNTAVYLRFLKKLLRSVKQKVFLITDKHPVHLGKMAREWLWANRKTMEVFYLPNYSPELNPVEYINQDIKTNVAGKRRAKDREELKMAVVAFANRKKKNPQQVKKYFQAPAVKYAAKPN
ncbi:MAG: IS630 family transposase [Flavisolibacter sp.]|nr:IS630 family transposase [Flavisolibacter sp.]MBD0364676.1 IS630 family transposase [Flavisolibacter sp.]